MEIKAIYIYVHTILTGKVEHQLKLVGKTNNGGSRVTV